MRHTTKEHLEVYAEREQREALTKHQLIYRKNRKTIRYIKAPFTHAEHQEISILAAKQGLSRSGYLLTLIREHLLKMKGPPVD